MLRIIEVQSKYGIYGLAALKKTAQTCIQDNTSSKNKHSATHKPVLCQMQHVTKNKNASEDNS